MTPPVTHEVNPEQKNASNKGNIGPRKKETFQLAVTPGTNDPKQKELQKTPSYPPFPRAHNLNQAPKPAAGGGTKRKINP